MPKRKTRSSCQSPEEQDNNCKTGGGNIENNNDLVVSRTRARRRLLCLNKIPDERSNSLSDVNSYCKETSFVATTELTSVQTHHIITENNFHETQINKIGNNCNINSRCDTLPVDTTQKQHNCNISRNNNSVPLNLRNRNDCKDKTECNSNCAQDNGSSRSSVQVSVVAPTQQLSNIDSYYSHWDSHVTKLPATTLVCGGGQESVSCQELECEDEPEPFMCTQDFLFGSPQNNDDLSEVRWDCKSPELMREVKQLQGLYGMEEIREVVSNFNDTDAELQNHIIPELNLYFPVKSDPILARKHKHQKAKVRAGKRLQWKIYGRESAEAILQWLQNKAAVDLPGDALEKTAALETLEAQPVCSYMTPSVSSEQDDLNMNITDDLSQTPLEVDETVSCQSSSTITTCADIPSITGVQGLHLSQEKTLDQIQTLSIADIACEQSLGIDEVLDSQDSAVSTLLSAPPRKTVAVEAALNSLHVQSVTTPSLSNETEDGTFSDDDGFLLGVDETLGVHSSTVSTSSSATPKIPASVEAALNSLHVQSVTTPSLSTETEDGTFSDDDGFLLGVDETLGVHYSTTSTSSSATPKLPATVEAALNSLHIQTAVSTNVSAAGDGTFSDDDDDLLLEADETLHSRCNTLLTSAAAPGKYACLESTLNSLHVQSVTTPSLSTETEDGAFSDDDGFLHRVESLDQYYSTVSISSPAPRKLASMEVTLNSLHVPTALTPNVSATEDGAFSDDDDFLLEVETLDNHCDAIFTSSTPPRKPSPLEATMNSLHVQSATTTNLTTTEQDAVDFSTSDEVFQQRLEVDKTSDTQASTVISLSSAAPKKTAPMEAALSFNCLQSVITSSVSAIGDGDCNDSISDDDDEFILDSQASTVFISFTHRKPASLESTLNLLPSQSAMTLCLCASEEDAFNVVCDEFEDTLDYQTGSVSTPKAMTGDSLKTLHPNSDMTQGSSATVDAFNVRIFDDEVHILQDDEETVDYQSGSIFTSNLELCKETTGVLATLNPLHVQSHVTPGVSTTADDGFDVSVSDDDLLFDFEETLDRQTSIVTTLPSVEATLKPHYVQSHVTASTSTTEDDGFDVSVSDNDLLVEVETLDRQTSVVTTLPSVEPTLKPLYVQSHVTPGVSTTEDDGFDVSDSDSDFLFEYKETLDRQANSTLSSNMSLYEKTAPVYKMALQLESDNVCGKKGFDVIIPDNDSQLLLDSSENLACRANICSISGAISLQTTTAVETLLRTQQIQQSDWIERVSTAQEEFASFPDDNFEQMIAVGDSLAGQISILSSSTVDLCENTAEVGTMKTLQIQSDLIHSDATTTDDTDFLDEDFDQMVVGGQVGESLGGQTNILSTPTLSELWDKTAEAETLEMLPIQSDVIQNISVIETEDANFSEDDFEYLQELGESLGSQTNILSTSTPSDFWDKTADAETWETLPIQSDVIQNMSLIENEEVNFSDDDFESLQDVQTNILSTPSSDLCEKTAAAQTLPIQSDMIQNITVTQVTSHNDAGNFHTSMTLQRKDGNISSSMTLHRQDGSIPSSMTLHRQDGSLSSSMTLNRQDSSIPSSMTLHRQDGSIPSSMTLHRQDGSIPSSMTLHRQDGSLSSSMTLHRQDGSLSSSMTLHNHESSSPSSLTLQSQDDNVSTSVTVIPGGLQTPISDNWNPSLSDTSLKTLQPSVKMNIIKSTNIICGGSNHYAYIRKSNITDDGSTDDDITKSTNITDGGTNHDAFTSDSKQFCLSKLAGSLLSSSSSRAVNNTLTNVNKPKQFKFKRISPLQMDSLPCVNTPSPFIPHFSNLSPGVNWSGSNSCSHAEEIQHQAEASACRQVQCSPGEIEQKRRVALQKRNLRLSQFKHAML